MRADSAKPWLIGFNRVVLALSAGEGKVAGVVAALTSRIRFLRDRIRRILQHAVGFVEFVVNRKRQLALSNKQRLMLVKRCALLGKLSIVKATCLLVDAIAPLYKSLCGLFSMDHLCQVEELEDLSCDVIFDLVFGRWLALLRDWWICWTVLALPLFITR